MIIFNKKQTLKILKNMKTDKIENENMILYK